MGLGLASPLHFVTVLVVIFRVGCVAICWVGSSVVTLTAGSSVVILRVGCAMSKLTDFLSIVL